MAGYTLSALEADIRSYCEVDSNVFSGAILGRFIENAENRICDDVPIDADRHMQDGNLVTDKNSIYAPSGALFTRGIEVYDSTSAATGTNRWLIKKDVTWLSEYIEDLTGSGGADVTGMPKYYAMFGGATGTSSTKSGGYLLAPTPDSNYYFRVHYDKRATTLGTNTSGTYISLNYPQLLLYACLVNAYGYLKGPMDMLTLYEQKYKDSVQTFASQQVGRRRRDDYTDGTVRIKIDSPSP